MADTVTTNVIFSGKRRYVAQFSNYSDGTGETAVKKVDASTLVGPDGSAPTSFRIEGAEWSVKGGSVTVLFDATTDDEALILSGAGFKDYSGVAGIKDPKTTGSTGDIMFTTNDFAAGSTYDITLSLILKD